MKRNEKLEKKTLAYCQGLFKILVGVSVHHELMVLAAGYVLL